MKAFPTAIALALATLAGTVSTVTTYAADAAAVVPDADLTKAVEAAIAAEPTLTGQKITVSTKDREVTLKGTVSDQQLMVTAGLTAEKVTGVKFVINDIFPADYTPSVAAQESKATKQ